jgi:hypothetical protein
MARISGHSFFQVSRGWVLSFQIKGDGFHKYWQYCRTWKTAHWLTFLTLISFISMHGAGPARDIQKWETVPLGPFLGKNFGVFLLLTLFHLISFWSQMESISILSLLMKLFNLPTAKAINSLCRKEFHWVVPLSILCYSGLFGGEGEMYFSGYSVH